MGETFLKLGMKVKEMYQNSLESVNMLIAIRNFLNDTDKSNNTTDPNNNSKDKSSNLVK